MIPDFTPLQWGAIWLAMGVGSVFQGALGFGLALVAGPFLVMIEPTLLPGPMLVAALIITTLTAHREWHGVRVKEVMIAMVGRLPGSYLGALLLTAVPLAQSRMLFGAIILAGVGLSVAGWRLLPTPRGLILAGILSGVMGTAGAVGGPPMALVYQNSPGAQLRGTLSLFFVASSFVSMLFLTLFGRFGSRELLTGVAMLPALLVGFWLSGFLTDRLERRHVRAAVLLLSTAAGVAVIIQSLW